MPVTVERLRAMLPALPDMAEGPCYGTPGFRVRGRLVAIEPDALAALAEAAWRRAAPKKLAALRPPG